MQTTIKIDNASQQQELVPMNEFVGTAHWYAAYTLPRHEKSVADQLGLKDVETYLPTFARLSKWTDRVRTIELPLFPGYVFVCMPLRDRVKVLQCSGVIRIVGFNGRPVPLPEHEINSIRASLAVARAEPYPYLAAGERVAVQAGPLAGIEGVVVRHKGRTRIVVSIASIHRSIALELESADVRALS